MSHFNNKLIIAFWSCPVTKVHVLPLLGLFCEHCHTFVKNAFEMDNEVKGIPVDMAQ